MEREKGNGRRNWERERDVRKASGKEGEGKERRGREGKEGRG